MHAIAKQGPERLRPGNGLCFAAQGAAPSNSTGRAPLVAGNGARPSIPAPAPLLTDAPLGSPSALITLCRPVSAALFFFDSCFCYLAPDHSLCRPSSIRAVSLFGFLVCVDDSCYCLCRLPSPRLSGISIHLHGPSACASDIPTPGLSCSLRFYVSLEQKPLRY